MTDAETLVKELDELVLHLREVNVLEHQMSRDDGVLIGYAPRGKGRLSNETGPVDPWWARAAQVTGTGQTLEMALLDLSSRLQADAKKILEDERARIAERTAAADRIAETLSSKARRK